MYTDGSFETSIHHQGEDVVSACLKTPLDVFSSLLIHWRGTEMGGSLCGIVSWDLTE